jgi:hypothetical protein
VQETVYVKGGAGIGLGTIAWIVLIILKATGNLAMSWLLVITAIVWVPLMIFLGAFIVVLIFAIIAALVDLL